MKKKKFSLSKWIGGELSIVDWITIGIILVFLSGTFWVILNALVPIE